MYRWLPCIQGKPKLTFDPSPDFPGNYYPDKHAINLDTSQDLPEFTRFTNDEYCAFILAYEYAHAYTPLTMRERLLNQDEGVPGYNRHEREIDHLTETIILAMIGENGFPGDRDRVLFLISLFRQSRNNHFLAMNQHPWVAKIPTDRPSQLPRRPDAATRRFTTTATAFGGRRSRPGPSINGLVGIALAPFRRNRCAGAIYCCWLQGGQFSMRFR